MNEQNPAEAGDEQGARTTSRAELSLGGRLGQGGQGTIYQVDGSAEVYKEYAAGVLPDLNAAALAAIVDFLNKPGTGNSDVSWLSARTAWPAAIVEDAGAVRGFLMREVPERFRFDYQGLTSAGTTRLANFEFLLNDDAYVGAVGLRVSERDRVLLLRDVAETLTRLHQMGITVGDLSPKNLLFTLAPQPECFLIDCDAMCLHGASVLPQAETPDWGLPVGEERATRAADAHKLALLAVRMFARDQMSTDPAALARLDPELGDLARAGLDADPAQRPEPALWAERLGAVADFASTIATTDPSLRPGVGWGPAQGGLGSSATWTQPNKPAQGRPLMGVAGPAANRPGMPTVRAKRGGVIVAVLCALTLALMLIAVNQNSVPTAAPASAVTASNSPDSTDNTASTGGPDNSSPSSDLMATAQVGSCFYNDGTSGDAVLVAASCTDGAFEVVQINKGTTDPNSCNNVAISDEGVSSTEDDLVLCLSYQSAYGDAFHAKQGDCVYGLDQTYATWDTEACQTGNFKVLAVYRGAIDSSKCKSWPDYDEYRYYTVPSDASLDVLLCLMMNYPDGAGDAVQNECLQKSGSVFTNLGTCNGANVYVTGRTDVYDDPSFCANDGSVWWENPDYPKLGYTVCYAWR